MAKKRTGKRRKQLLELDEIERQANAALVHSWMIAQCEIDPEFREVYETYIGPVPSRIVDFRGMRSPQG